jgi:hypothetical protein
LNDKWFSGNIHSSEQTIHWHNCHPTGAKQKRRQPDTELTALFVACGGAG